MMKIAFTLGSILLLVANAAPAFEGVQRAPLNALISQHAAHTTHWHLDIQKHGSTDRYRICG